MMKGIKFAQQLFRRPLQRATNTFLEELTATAETQRLAITTALAQLNAGKPHRLYFGDTKRDQRIEVPLEQALAHGLVLGASGAGKSYLALSWLTQLLPHSPVAAASFGLLDAKGELFEKALQYLAAHLYRLPPQERAALQQKIIVIDFSNTESITPYHLLARQAEVADEMMVANRIEMISAQFAGLSEMTVRMKMILKYFLLLMTEFNLSLPFLETLCNDPVILQALVARSQNLAVKDYFLHRFADESKITLLALRQRMDALLVSEGVRASLSARSAPDFARLQDQGFIILINTAGRNITRGMSELLQGLILSDIKQGVFRRANPAQKFLWFFDEAQNLYKTPANRESMVDLLTMARSFGSFFVLLTQSLTSAVRDQDVLNSILANVRWIVMLRSTLRDAGIVSPALPLTGTLHKPQGHLFEAPKHLNESEERKARLDEITKLPDRQAWCWLKAQLHTAVKIVTPLVPRPHELAGCRASELTRFLEAVPLGQGLPKEAIRQEVKRQQDQLYGMCKPSRPAPPPQRDVANLQRKKRSRIKALEDEFSLED